VDTFFRDADQLLADMQQAVETGDAAKLRLAAHSLKSNGASLGAQALSVECQHLEQRAKAGLLEDAIERLARIRTEYLRARAALESLQLGA
jgi:two-component system, sensor histidine kinase and response regulator